MFLVAIWIFQVESQSFKPKKFNFWVWNSRFEDVGVLPSIAAIFVRFALIRVNFRSFWVQFCSIFRFFWGLFWVNFGADCVGWFLEILGRFVGDFFVIFLVDVVGDLLVDLWVVSGRSILLSSRFFFFRFCGPNFSLF